MPDSAQSASGQESSLSPEIADYFGENSGTVPSEEKVTPDGTGQDADADTTKENDSEKKEEDVKSDVPPEVKETPTDKKEGEDASKKDAQPTEFEVAGTKYSTLKEAVEAVNRINGRNAMMSGELKTLRKDRTELQGKVESLEKLLSDYKTANEDWQKYYEDGGEKPEVSKVNIEEAIEKKIIEIKDKEKQIATKEQFETELDEIFAEPDFEQIKPFFQELVDEYDGVPKVNPKKLYERAKVLAKKDLLKEGIDIEKMVEERVNKKLAQTEASKTSAASGGSSTTVDPFEGMSPEVKEYFQSRQ